MIIDSDIYLNPTLNIGILGCISSGKSTLMNSLFSETYSDMKIKKTTMCPQIYKTDRKMLKNKKYAGEIRKKNEEINKKLYEEKDSNKCQEIVYNVLPIPHIFDDVEFGKDIEYKIYDIPGLNDSVTKNIFYDYIKNNFYKFDIVIYNIDINSGLNTTDELDILKLIKECQLNIKKNYNKEVKLMIICNKCDDLAEDEHGNLVGSEEIEEMYKQVCEIVKENNMECPIIKYSAAYTYMYRSINTPENIDIQYINKIGIDNFGRVPWSKQSKGKTVDQLWNLIKPHLSDCARQSLVLSGFEQLKKVICIKILQKGIADVMYSKIYFHKEPSDFMTKYKFIKKLDGIFKNSKCGKKILSFFFKEYVEYLKVLYDTCKIDKINDNNITFAEEYFTILQELEILDLDDEHHEIVSEFINGYNLNKANYDIGLIQSNREIKKGEIIPILKQIMEKTNDGVSMISKTDVIEKLEKVPIDDFYNMTVYLEKNNIDHKLLINIYSHKIITAVNNNEYSPMIKNYLMKIYLENNDEFFNWMSCCIKVNVFSSKYDKEQYDLIIGIIDQFIKFYNIKSKKIILDNSDSTDQDSNSEYVTGDEYTSSDDDLVVFSHTDNKSTKQTAKPTSTKPTAKLTSTKPKCIQTQLKR
jgi:hypothetical protein